MGKGGPTVGLSGLTPLSAARLRAPVQPSIMALDAVARCTATGDRLGLVSRHGQLEAMDMMIEVEDWTV